MKILPGLYDILLKKYSDNTARKYEDINTVFKIATDLFRYK